MGNSKSKHKAGPADDAWLIPQVGDLVDVRVPNGWTVGEVTKRHKNGDVSVTTNEIGKDSNNNDVYGITYRLNKAEHHGKMAAMGTYSDLGQPQHAIPAQISPQVSVHSHSSTHSGFPTSALLEVPGADSASSPRRSSPSSAAADQLRPQVGNSLDVLDYFPGKNTSRPMQQWFPAEVVRVQADKALVSFFQFESDQDTWIQKAEYSARFAPLGSKSTNSQPQYLDEEALPHVAPNNGGGETAKQAPGGHAPASHSGIARTTTAGSAASAADVHSDLSSTPLSPAFTGAQGSGVSATPSGGKRRMGPSSTPAHEGQGVASPVNGASEKQLDVRDPSTYSRGAWLDVQLGSGRWVLAQILAVTRDESDGFTAIEVRFPAALSFETDKGMAQDTVVVAPDHSNVAVSGTRSSVPQHSWGVGQYVDVLDVFPAANGGGWQQEWRWGEIAQANVDAVLVKFVDAPGRPDMWFNCSNPDIAQRLQAHGSVTTSSPSAEQQQRQVDDSRFRAALTEAGFCVHDVANDGACLFRAVAHQVYGDASRHRLVRERVLKHMKEHSDVYSIMAAASSDGGLDEYLKRMQADFEWGGYPEQLAIEEAFDRPVLVYSSEDFEAGGRGGVQPSTIHFEGELPTAELEKHNVSPILLAYHGGQHYNSLVAEGAPEGAKPPLGTRDTQFILQARQCRLLEVSPVAPSHAEGGLGGGKGDEVPTTPTPTAPPGGSVGTEAKGQDGNATPVKGGSGPDPAQEGLTSTPPPKPTPGAAGTGVATPPSSALSTPRSRSGSAVHARQRTRPSFDAESGKLTFVSMESPVGVGERSCSTGVLVGAAAAAAASGSPLRHASASIVPTAVASLRSEALGQPGGSQPQPGAVLPGADPYKGNETASGAADARGWQQT